MRIMCINISGYVSMGPSILFQIVGTEMFSSQLIYEFLNILFQNKENKVHASTG